MAFVTPTPFTARRATLPSRAAQRPRATRRVARQAPPRMIAVKPVAATPLTQKARELLSYVRGHKSIFQPGAGFNATHCALFRKNDTGRSFTPLDELATNAHMLPGGSVAVHMVVQEDELVRQACEAVYAQFGSVKDNDAHVEILEFDLRYLLRVISYGAACQATDFIHANNMGMMRMLHAEVGLPEGADAHGLQAAKEAVLAHVESGLVDSTAACFDVVIDMLS